MFRKLLLGTVGAIAFASLAQAAPIVGSFGLSGSALPQDSGGNTVQLLSATQLQFNSIGSMFGTQIPYTFFSNPADATGNYAAIIGGLEAQSANPALGGLGSAYGHIAGTTVPSTFVIPTSTGAVSVPSFLVMYTDVTLDIGGNSFSDSGVAGLELDITNWTSISFEDDPNGDFVNITGTGVVRAIGFDETTASFSLTINETNNAATWTWTSGVSSPVPEPTTMTLLGAGLAGIGLLARRRRKSA